MTELFDLATIPNLDNIPPEIIEIIALRFVPEKSLWSLGMTCKSLYQIFTTGLLRIYMHADNRILNSPMGVCFKSGDIVINPGIIPSKFGQLTHLRVHLSSEYNIPTLIAPENLIYLFIYPHDWKERNEREQTRKWHAKINMQIVPNSKLCFLHCKVDLVDSSIILDHDYVAVDVVDSLSLDIHPEASIETLIVESIRESRLESLASLGRILEFDFTPATRMTLPSNVRNVTIRNSLYHISMVCANPDLSLTLYNTDIRLLQDIKPIKKIAVIFDNCNIIAIPIVNVIRDRNRKEFEDILGHSISPVDGYVIICIDLSHFMCDTIRLNICNEVRSWLPECWIKMPERSPSKEPTQVFLTGPNRYKPYITWDNNNRSSLLYVKENHKIKVSDINKEKIILAP